MSKETHPESDSTPAPAIPKTTRERFERCLSCHWSDSENVQPVNVNDLVLCTGAIDPASRLRALRRKGLATSKPMDNEWPFRLQFSPADTPEAKAYVSQLPTGPCLNETPQPTEALRYATLPQVTIPGVTSAEALAEANTAAEAFLLENNEGIRGGGQIRRRFALGCLACHLFREPNASVTARKIANCTGTSVETAYHLLEATHQAGLLTMTDETATAAQRKFTLGQSEAASEFEALLQPPAVCAYEAGKEQHQQSKLSPGPDLA